MRRAMHGAEAHADRELPAIAAGTLAAGAVAVVAAWAVTWWGMDGLDAFLMEIAGASPADALVFLGLAAAMMAAMMLPSALPMIEVVRGLAARDAGPRVARVRVVVFTVAYVLVWALFAAAALAFLALTDLLGDGAPRTIVPALVLVAAGVYQVTAWKLFCLHHCRSPTSFLLQHWRGGHGGAFRMGLGHAAYCLGCCWLLMLVLFTAGAMSVLWMGVFSLLILAEKTLPRGEAVSRATGAVAVAAGIAVAALAFWPA